MPPLGAVFFLPWPKAVLAFAKCVYVEDCNDHTLRELYNLLGLCNGDLTAPISSFKTWLDLVLLLFL